ncbi:MAG: hypothetical protein HPY83_15230 [Anaerolineae bacterium]|nr:hypothetical protein [Anaerolineae bacterium]
MKFEAYSYRISSRFGSRVWVEVLDGQVSVTGPRVPVPAYRLWLGIQALLLAATLPLLLLGLLRRSGGAIAAGLSTLLLHLAVGGFGAGCMWEAMNLNAFSEGKRGETQSFPVSAVRDVRIGRGWARKGLWLVLLPYVRRIDALAEGHAVSFEAPDDGTGANAVYALHMRTPEDALQLVAILR